MNTEQKAKAYDKVLEKANALYKAAEPMSGCNVILETLFPELKESENERIRKWLIAQLKIKIGDNATLNNMIYKAIAWLEKQGEQKYAWSEEDERIIKRIDSLLYSINESDFEDIHAWLKSLKERYTWKPSDGQIKALKEACDKSWELDGLDPLYTLYDDLKKIKG